MTAQTQVAAARVRYIKLGENGSWAAQCIAESSLRIGFWTDRYFELCMQRQWGELEQAFKSHNLTRGTITRFVGEVRTVYEDDGSILWITFEHQKLFWAFIDPRVEPWKATEGEEGSYRKVVGWRSTDLAGNELDMATLSGNLTKTHSYRGTSCDIGDPRYVVSRINGEQLPEVIEAARLAKSLEGAIVPVMRRLTWQDFELLVELVFAQSGWRRISPTGKVQKTIDIDLQLPSTGERAFIQVKSSATQADFEDYRQRFQGTGYDRMFFVYHTPSGPEVTNEDEDIIVLGPSEFAHMVLEAGLFYWLMSKVA